jgi:hypothetical protein
MCLPGRNPLDTKFILLAPGLSVLADQAYRMYIESLFDEIGPEIRVLPDRRTGFLLWPRRPALLELLEVLNAKVGERLGRR